MHSRHAQQQIAVGTLGGNKHRAKAEGETCLVMRGLHCPYLASSRVLGEGPSSWSAGYQGPLSLPVQFIQDLQVLCQTRDCDARHEGEACTTAKSLLHAPLHSDTQACTVAGTHQSHKKDAVQMGMHCEGKPGMHAHSRNAVQQLS